MLGSYNAETLSRIGGAIHVSRCHLANAAGKAPFPPEAKPRQGSRIVNELVGETIVILQSETAKRLARK